MKLINQESNDEKSKKATATEKSWTASQKSAIEFPGGNLLISANAGSGKTAAIVESILYKIQFDELKINRLLLITFTNAAANEMKTRLAKELSKKINDPNAQNKDALTEAKENLPFADIGTIDSFCSKTVRQYADRLDVSGDFTIMDEKETEKYRLDALEKFFRQKFNEKDDDFRSVYDYFYQNRSDDELREKILFVENKLSSIADPEVFLDETTKDKCGCFPGSFFEEFCFEEASKVNNIDETEREFKFYHEQYKGYNPKISEKAKLLQELCSDVKNKNNYDRAKYISEKIKGKSFPKDDPDFYQTVSKLKSQCSFLINLANHLSDDAEALNTMKKFFVVVKEYLKLYDEEKKKDNKMTFSDLERYCLNLIKQEEVLNDLKASYDFIFVDEYQDINDIQDKIFNTISENNLTVVGDKKQSIYGFRGSDSKLFSDRYEKYAFYSDEYNRANVTGAKITFDENFRSAKGIIDFVNAFFAPIMKDYQNLARGNENIDVDDCVRIRFYKSSDQDEKKDTKNAELPESENDPSLKQKTENTVTKIYSVKEAEIPEQGTELAKARVLYNEIQNLIGKRVKLTEQNNVDGQIISCVKEKEIKPGDIAVLIRGKSSLKTICKLEEMGVKLDLSGVDSQIDYPEKGFLLSVFKLLLNDMRDFALATVMLSPLGNLNKDELAQIAVSTRNFKPGKDKPFYFERVNEFLEKNPNDEISKKIYKLRQSLEKYRVYSFENNAGAVAEKIITDCNYRAYLSGKKDGKERLNALSALISEAEKFPSVSDFADYFEKAKNDDIKYQNPPAVGSAVKVCTIHKSKGLQYPAVIYFDFDKDFNTGDSDKGKQILFDREWGFAMPYYIPEQKSFKETARQEAFSLKIKKQIVKEELRLAYVAMTRAEYFLTIIAQKPKEEKEGAEDSATNPVNWLITLKNDEKNILIRNLYEQALENVYILNDIIDTEEKDASLQAKENEKRDYGKIKPAKQLLDEALNFKYADPDATRVKSKYSVTEMVKLSEDDKKDVIPIISDQSEDKSFEEKIKEGIALHAAMQHIPLPFKGNEDEVLSELKALSEEGVILKEDFDKISPLKVLKCLDKVIIPNVDESDLIYREQKFLLYMPANEVFGIIAPEKQMVSREKIILQGTIDLLIKKKNGQIILVDYKASGKNSELLQETYAPQLELYSLAIEKILGKKPDKKLIYNFNSEELITIN